MGPVTKRRSASGAIGQTRPETADLPTKGELLGSGRVGADDSKRAASLTEAALDVIRDRIIDLTLAPGSKVDEQVLDEQYRLGRTPIREAINRLAAEGFVGAVPQRRGMFVRKLDLDEMSAVIAAHEVAEATVGQLCRFEDPALADDLVAINERFDFDCVEQSKFVFFTELNQQFHLRLCRDTRNTLICDFVESTHRHVRRLTVYALKQEVIFGPDNRKANFEQHLNHHRAIIEAVRTRDREALIDRLTSHARQHRTRLQRLLAATSGGMARNSPPRFAAPLTT